MFKVLNKLLVGSMYCVSVEGDILLLKNGLILTDEKENISPFSEKCPHMHLVATNMYNIHFP